MSLSRDLTGFQRRRFELDSTWSGVCLRRKVGCETCQVWDAPLSFPRLPEGYQDLVPALWSARGIGEIVPLAEKLVHSFWRLLVDEGIHVENYQAVDNLPL
jgi:hypothetical protein